MNTTTLRLCLTLLLCTALASITRGTDTDSTPFPGPDISPTVASAAPDAWTLGNNILLSTFTLKDGSLHLAQLKNELTGETLEWNDPNLFTLHLNGHALSSSSMKLIAAPTLLPLRGDPKLARLAERFDGQALAADFADMNTGISVHYAAILRDGSNYLRQEISITSAKPVPVTDIEMLNVKIDGAKIVGYTDGSPIVAGHWFLGMEHPMAKTFLTGTDGWSPADLQAHQFYRTLIKLTPGPLTIKFNFTHGNHRFDINKVALITNGKEVSQDTHHGYAGKPSLDNTYTLTVPENTPTADLLITVGGNGNETNSYGSLVPSVGQFGNIKSAVCSRLPRESTLKPADTWTLSTEVGVAPEGQLRRAFAYYLQRERAHPYRQYWHYNSWFDLNIGHNDDGDYHHRMNEAQCANVIQTFDRELFQKRGVGLNGYVWDDGWDDWHTLWQFHKGFPNGFSKLAELAKPQGATMGAWLSPWGGYGGSHDQRVAFGRQQGYETNAGGFSLGGPRYYAAFRDACLNMIRDYGQGYFKFDGIGGGAFATGAPARISSDLDGLVHLISDLRAAKPDIFINCTVGTWASPYWTRFADSIWRQGADSDFSGKGNNRERWINYKDSIVYDRFVSQSPLFPINSLMYHGVYISPTFNGGQMPTPAQNLASTQHEMRMTVGYASGLGELYITPSLMTPESWDTLADCIKLARAKQAILVDSHWIGGDPRKDQIYGFAAWHPTKGAMLTLRNPSDQPQTISIDIAQALELTPGSPTKYHLTSPYKDQKIQTLTLEVGVAREISLEPFDVITFEAAP